MRIRTIKPEFWVSESVGRLSRDARLLFVGLWSFADDSGRGRGALPAISGALFPYDDDALKKLPGWLAELEREGMIRRYKGPDGNSYLDIPKWLDHQRIEKPSRSKFPSFGECSGNSRGIVGEMSPLEQGTGNREQGPMEQGPMEQGGVTADNPRKAGFDRPSIEEVKLAAEKAGLPEVEADKFFAYYESNGWKVGRNPMKSWKSAMAGWQARWREKQQLVKRPSGKPVSGESREIQETVELKVV